MQFSPLMSLTKKIIEAHCGELWGIKIPRPQRSKFARDYDGLKLGIEVPHCFHRRNLKCTHELASFWGYSRLASR